MCCYIWNKHTSNPKLIIYKNKAKSVVFQILGLTLHPKRVVWQARQTYNVEVKTIAKSLPLLRKDTHKSLILSYSEDFSRILRKNMFLKYINRQLWGKCGEKLDN